MRPRSSLGTLGRLAVCLLLVASLGTVARGQAPPAPPPAQPVPVASPSAPIVPDITGGCPCASGDAGTQFGIDLLLGQFTGFRGQAAVYRTPEGAFVLEAFYGALA